MEKAAELSDYLPLSFNSPEEQEYVAFLWDTFETNYTHGKYQFAFLAYHMLTNELRLLQHLADQEDGAQELRDEPNRLRQGRGEELDCGHFGASAIKCWSSLNFPVKSPYGSPRSVKLLIPPTCLAGEARCEAPRLS